MQRRIKSYACRFLRQGLAEIAQPDGSDCKKLVDENDLIRAERNPSLLVMARIADALSLPITRLLEP